MTHSSSVAGCGVTGPTLAAPGRLSPVAGRFAKPFLHVPYNPAVTAARPNKLRCCRANSTAASHSDSGNFARRG